MSHTKFYTLTIIIGLLFAVAFNVWLDSGCSAPLHTGIITTHGKACE